MLRHLLSLPVLLFALPLAVSADCMGPYPPSMVKAYKQNCAQDDKSQPFCNCIIDEVQKTIPLADFIEMSNTEGGLAADQRFTAVTKKCTPLMSGGASAPAISQPFGPPKEATVSHPSPAEGKEKNTR